MPHDIQLTEPANRVEADRLVGLLLRVFRREGEPWQHAEREARVRELRAEILGEDG